MKLLIYGLCGLAILGLSLAFKVPPNDVVGWVALTVAIESTFKEKQ